MVENALSAEQIAQTLKHAKQYAKQYGDNFADALSFSTDFLELVDVPDVLDVVAHWLGPNLYVNHSHVVRRGAGKGDRHGWHQDGGSELPDGGSFPMFMKVGFVLTDMTEKGYGNFGCVPLTRVPEWGEQDGKKAIVNADTLLLNAGSAVLFEQCWHAGLGNQNNPEDRYVFYVQYARRILQPFDPARYGVLREQTCSPLQEQLLMLPSDAQYLRNNRSCLYAGTISSSETLPLKIRQKQRGIPTRKLLKEARPPVGYVNKVVPVDLVAQIDALIEAHEAKH